jgi:vanillate/3-O-methylgallate O-demethylase
MAKESLETAIKRTGNPVKFMRNSQYPSSEFPVKPEFSNWRSEQQAWRKSCVILDQSHHMVDLFVSGPGSFKALSALCVNSFANFEPGMAKQYVATNADGHFMGDGVLFYERDGSFDLVSNAAVCNWIQFNLEKGGQDVKIERDNNSYHRDGDPKLYRYELQGPKVGPLIEKLTGEPMPNVKFFHMTTLKIAGREVNALRHGMAGQPGFEIYGPWVDNRLILDEILKVGEEFGLVRAGAKAYSTANLESGWIPHPITAIFGEREKAYREWLPATAMGSLAGSMDSDDITDYYVTPYDIGYGKIVKFDHDFLGRDALEKIAQKPRRDKVTLVWNKDDVAAAIKSHFEPGIPAKYFEMPKSRYGYFQIDKVMKNGKMVGMSTDVGYITNEHSMVSLASLDLDACELGTEVTVLWGENPNSSKPAVEAHRQVEIRATVAPCPYAQVVRASYRKS